MTKTILILALIGMLLFSLEAAPQAQSSSMEYVKRGLG
jgi:hypothetical protein